MTPHFYLGFLVSIFLYTLKDSVEGHLDGFQLLELLTLAFGSSHGLRLMRSSLASGSKLGGESAWRFSLPVPPTKLVWTQTCSLKGEKFTDRNLFEIEA